MTQTIGCLTIDPKGRTTLPREMRDALGLSPGTLLRVDRSDSGTFELVPVEMVPRDQMWFHSPETQSRIAAAEEDFREGRFIRTRGSAETQRYLDSLKEENSATSKKC